MSSARGRFIVFEGGEGSGKSTQIRNLQEFLKSKGIASIQTFEPGGTSLGISVRELLLKPTGGSMDPKTEALLFAAVRAEHVSEKILPALTAGTWVLCDRYIDSSLAYQGVARGLGMRRIRELNEWATSGLLPDRSYFLDIDPSDGMARVQQRLNLQGSETQKDRLENEAIAFHEKVRASYRFLAEAGGDRYRILDAKAPIDEVKSQIERDICEQFL